MSENFNYCHVVGKTDVGRKRAANEDNMYNTITQNGLVSVVCDGMGGHVGGATASKIAVDAIIENLNNVYYDDPRIAIGESIDIANNAIIQKSKIQPELSGMGSTCVLLIVRAGKVYIGHVGDSRIYLVRNRRIVQLTKDHSYVQMLVDCGEITKEQAEHHPRKNEITNALGIPNMSPATVADDVIVPEAGDCFVLCSDGLSGMVSDDTICKIISRQSEMNAQERVNRLVELANENGGVDNITVQLVEFSVSPNEITAKKIFPVWAKITGVISLIIALVVGGHLLLKDKPQPPEEDTRPAVNVINKHLGKIEYKKNGQIVELVFSDNSMELKRNNESLDIVEGVAFDPATLSVETKNIQSQYNNSLLTFTDKEPGDTIIVFSITTSDKQKVYRCTFTIDKKGVDISIPQSPVHKKEPQKKEIEVATYIVDTIPLVQFEYEKLEKGSKLLLNYFAKPKLIFNQKEKSDETSIGDSIIGDIISTEYDDVYWEKDPKSSSRQLSFTFKGKASDIDHKFAILCKLRDSERQYMILVKVVPKKDIVEDIKEIEAKDKDSDIGTIPCVLKYNNSGKYSEMQFNYMGTPYILFNGIYRSPIDYEIDSIAEIPNNNHWDIEHNGNRREIIFSYKGDASEAPQGIQIPFYAKGMTHKNIISIEFISADSEGDEKVTSDTEEGDDDGNTEPKQEMDME